MKSKITFVALLVTGLIFSQNPLVQVGGGEEVFPKSSEACISEEERSDLFKQVDLNIVQLKNQGRYMAPNKQGNHPLFIFPVEQVDDAETAYHNVWGLSNYIDHNPSFPNQIQDFDCGTRSYDTTGGYNHDGYDIFTWPFWWKQMDLNQSISIAGADGQIVFKQDGNFDQNCSFNNMPFNGIIIQHSDGSRSWYLHFKDGTITNKVVGDTVVAGEYLGVIGSSGSSTGPHLHFSVFDNNNNLIDPTVGPCNDQNDDTWWEEPISYYNSGINAVLTHTAFPEFNTCPEIETTFESNQFALEDVITWALYLRDQRANTVLHLRTIRPDNSVQFDWDFDLGDDLQISWWAWQFAADMEGTWIWEVTYMDETVTHSFDVGVLSVEDQILTSTNIYPNPTQDQVTLQFGQPVAEATVIISNVLGQEIARRNVTNENEINLELEGSAGLYFVTVNIADRQATYRVIKN